MSLRWRNNACSLVDTSASLGGRYISIWNIWNFDDQRSQLSATWWDNVSRIVDTGSGLGGGLPKVCRPHDFVSQCSIRREESFVDATVLVINDVMVAEQLLSGIQADGLDLTRHWLTTVPKLLMLAPAGMISYKLNCPIIPNQCMSQLEGCILLPRDILLQTLLDMEQFGDMQKNRWIVETKHSQSCKSRRLFSLSKKKFVDPLKCMVYWSVIGGRNPFSFIEDYLAICQGVRGTFFLCISSAHKSSLTHLMFPH